MIHKRFRALVLGPLLIACLAVRADFARADTTYILTIDPTQSTITASGYAAFAGPPNFPYSEQAPGSLTTTLSGSISVETGGTMDSPIVEFPNAGDAITPDVNGDWSPAAGGAAGTQPAQFGAFIDIGSGAGVAWASHDNLLSANSPELTWNADGTFDSTVMNIVLANSVLDYRWNNGFGSGSQTTTNDQGANQVGGGQFIVSGNVATLTLPYQISIDQTLPSTQAHTVLSGQIVASQTTVPGDVNFDGIVNGQDIATIASNWLATGTAIPGDANGDGIVNGQDIALIASNWLQAGGRSGSAVPEPASLVLTLLAGFLLLTYWRSCRSR